MHFTIKDFTPRGVLGIPTKPYPRYPQDTHEDYYEIMKVDDLEIAEAERNVRLFDGIKHLIGKQYIDRCKYVAGNVRDREEVYIVCCFGKDFCEDTCTVLNLSLGLYSQLKIREVEIRIQTQQTATMTEPGAFCSICLLAAAPKSSGNWCSECSILLCVTHRDTHLIDTGCMHFHQGGPNGFPEVDKYCCLEIGKKNKNYLLLQGEWNPIYCI